MAVWPARRAPQRIRPAEAARHLAGGDRVAGIRGETGIEDVGELRVALEALRDRHRVGAGASDPQVQRAYPAQQQPRLEGPEAAAAATADVADRLPQRILPGGGGRARD